MCQYTNIHDTRQESEDFVIQECVPNAQAPEKDSPFIPMPKGQGSSGSGRDNETLFLGQS